MELDTTDRDLLAALLEDARISQRGLAKRVGVAQGTITNRLRRLEEMGIIRGCTSKNHGRSFNICFGFVSKPQFNTTFASLM